MIRTIRIALLAGMFFAVRDMAACGLDWNLPSNHFEGIDPQGYVSYWERIGELNCGNGLIVPLQLNFNSGRDSNASSPHLGQGWLLPLLESKIVQVSEDRFYMVQPDGIPNLFMRASWNSSILNGSAGWKAEVTDHTITASAPCGWKLVFIDGRIASMLTPKGQRIDWIYEAKRVAELRNGSTTLLKVGYDAALQASALELGNGKRFLITQEKKPRVQVVDGHAVIAGLENSLETLILPDGSTRRYKFGVTEKMQPKLEIARRSTSGPLERVILWDAATKHVLKDGSWNYRVSTPATPDTNVSIERDDGAGQWEFWEDDPANARSTSIRNGIKEVQTKFASGVNAGRIRETRSSNGKESWIAYKANFDEKGNKLRTLTSDGKQQIGTMYQNGRPQVIMRDSSGWKVDYQSGIVTPFEPNNEAYGTK